MQHPLMLGQDRQGDRTLKRGARRGVSGRHEGRVTVSDLLQLDEDVVRWTDTQPKALRDAARSGASLPLDWENLTEEVKDLGKSWFPAEVGAPAA